MNTIKTELKWALLFTAMMLVWMTGERLFGLHDFHLDWHAIVTNFVAVPAITMYVFALRAKRKTMPEQKMTYLQGLKSGALLSLLIAALTPVTQYISLTWISPYYFENVINYSVALEMMDEASAREYFNLSNYIIQGSIGALIMGLITSAIVAVFIRR